MQMRTSRSGRMAGSAALTALLALPAAAQQAAPPPPVEEWMKTGTRELSDLPFGMGLLPASDAAYARSPRLQFALATRGTLPDHLILDKWLPPVAQQGRQGSCVGWSLAYYAYTYAVSRQRRLDQKNLLNPRFEFSPAFIYHQGNKGKDAGMTIEEGCRLLAGVGCSSLVEMPYSDTDYTTPPGGDALKRAANFRAPGYGYLFDHPGTANPDTLKLALVELQQPFVMGIIVFKDFPHGAVESDYVYDLSIEPTKENFLGGHAICVVGYDESKKAFRVVNSWGPQWGDKGYLWISENFVRRYTLCGYAFLAGGPTARDGGKIAPHITVIPPKEGKATFRQKPTKGDRKE